MYVNNDIMGNMLNIYANEENYEQGNNEDTCTQICIQNRIQS